MITSERDRLHAENERLAAALLTIVREGGNDGPRCVLIAREALVPWRGAR
jgi:hypothetical protein